MDVIPEQVYGPYGYIDDIYITTYIIKKIADELGYEFLQKHWKENEKLESVVEECYEKSLEVLGDKTEIILSYVGFKE